jgi:hypothetical protein
MVLEKADRPPAMLPNVGKGAFFLLARRLFTAAALLVLQFAAATRADLAICGQIRCRV